MLDETPARHIFRIYRQLQRDDHGSEDEMVEAATQLAKRPGFRGGLAAKRRAAMGEIFHREVTGQKRNGESQQRTMKPLIVQNLIISVLESVLKFDDELNSYEAEYIVRSRLNANLTEDLIGSRSFSKKDKRTLTAGRDDVLYAIPQERSNIDDFVETHAIHAIAKKAGLKKQEEEIFYRRCAFEKQCEIAQDLDITPNAVQKTKSRLKTKLKKFV